MLICGIDEAGRGPLIGPLVIAGVVADDTIKQRFEQLGVTDSKLIAPLRREQLADIIKEQAVRFHIIVVSPEEVDVAVESTTTNLNFLEGEKSAEILNVLSPEKGILDCPSTNTRSYEEFVRSRLNQQKLPLIVEHKADLNHIESAAASILAKVTRDTAIEQLKKKIGINFGSGYPADPRTIAFVKEHVKDYPDLFRKSWKTYKQAMAKDPSKQDVLF